MCVCTTYSQSKMFGDHQKQAKKLCKVNLPVTVWKNSFQANALKIKMSWYDPGQFRLARFYNPQPSTGMSNYHRKYNWTFINICMKAIKSKKAFMCTYQ